MSTVALRFRPAAEHVRTARLVAVAVARRAGFDADQLDEVRLAVGEMCARAVRRCEAGGVDMAVLVEVDDVGPALGVVVTDQAGVEADDDELIALALVRGLADSVSIEDGPGGSGGRVQLSWKSARI